MRRENTLSPLSEYQDFDCGCVRMRLERTGNGLDVNYSEGVCEVLLNYFPSSSPGGTRGFNGCDKGGGRHYSQEWIA